MAARGDISRAEVTQPTAYSATIPGALGIGNTDFSREQPPKSNGGSVDPPLPTYGQIFPLGYNST